MSRCKQCKKELPTQEQWETIQPGEGEHLCWNGYNCTDEPEVSYEDLENQVIELKAMLIRFYKGTLYCPSCHRHLNPPTHTKDCDLAKLIGE